MEPRFAAVLSFFVPGLGQLYKGQILSGIVWFFFVCMGYLALFLPGLVLHFFCVLGALGGNPWIEGKTMVVRQQGGTMTLPPRTSTAVSLQRSEEIGQAEAEVATVEALLVEAELGHQPLGRPASPSRQSDSLAVT